MKELYVSRVGLFGVIGNFLLMFLKFIGGLLFKSQAMIADAVNSLMDIFASFMTLLGGKIASEPRDKDHNFGHGKAEFLFSLFVSLSMIFSSLYILSSSIQNFFNGHVIHYSYLLIVVCFITILVKFLLFLYSRKVYQVTENLLVYSNMIDHRNDMVITSLTLLSILFSYYHISFVDNVVGLCISLWIFYSGIKIFIQSYHILMDESMEETKSVEIKSFILKEKGVQGITKFETVPAGSQYILVLSILVNRSLKTYESHAIADHLEKRILKKYPELLAVTIHVNPTKKRKRKD